MTRRVFAWRNFLIGAFFALVAPMFAYASTIYLEPQSGLYGPGDTFIVTVRLDNNGECVNTFDVAIAYPKEKIRASAFSQGESIITLWAEQPKIDKEKGLVTFSGGVPGGYCGRIAGDPGVANILGKIIFTIPANQEGRPVSVGETAITILPTSQVLLSDGRGTPTNLIIRDALFRIASSTGTSTINEWIEELATDQISPEQFGIDIYRDTSTAGGKYFAVFQTTDKQSGIDHYEIMERDRDRPEFVRGTRDPAIWRPATSPFVLVDQDLKSEIIVKAIDNAGNTQIASLFPGSSQTPSSSNGAYLWIAIAVFVVAVTAGIFLRRKPHG